MFPQVSQSSQQRFIEWCVARLDFTQFRFGVVGCDELGIPSPLELGRDESVTRIDFVILLERAIRFVPKLLRSLTSKRYLVVVATAESVAGEEACLDA